MYRFLFFLLSSLFNFSFIIEEVLLALFLSIVLSALGGSAILKLTGNYYLNFFPLFFGFFLFNTLVWFGSFIFSTLSYLSWEA